MQRRTIERVLVATRGHTAAGLCAAIEAGGSEAVALYSPADAEAAHLDTVAYAAPISASDAADPYEDTARIIGAALDSGADAVHPGVATLAHSGEFARSVAAVGLALLGPRAEELDATADRAALRRHAHDLGLDTVGCSPLVDGEAAAEHWIEHFGPPLLVRAGVRGPGRAAVLAGSVAAARRAVASFRGAPVIIERAVAAARHLVVVVIGDGEGNVLHLGEHERSLADRGPGGAVIRVRECPSAAFPAGGGEARERLHAAAIRFAASARHLGVGGVEFLLGRDRAWFHDFDPGLPAGFAVHDACYGLSVVSAQVQIAAGESLGWSRGELVPGPHAIELLLCATAPGHLEELAFPAGADVVTALAPGAIVDPARDPVIASLRVSAPTRSAAIVRARATLEAIRIDGVPHDTDRLITLLADPRMWEGNTTPDLLDP